MGQMQRKSPGRNAQDTAATQGKTTPPTKESRQTLAEEQAAAHDAARQSAAQRAAQQAEVLHKGVFPALMASALALDQFFDTAAYRLYLEQMLEAAGSPTDPIERMMVEQLCMAHFRIAQLHVGAGQAKGTEVTRIYNTLAARMLGEFRRTALALRAYRGRVPESTTGGAKPKLKLFKMAQ